MGVTTRLQLFIDIAAELGEAITLTASGTGSTTSFLAATDMLYEDGSLNGREAWYATAGVASAANKWTRRVVIGTDEDAGTITVSPAWSAAPITGDVLILVNARGTSVTVPDIHKKINQLIRRVATELATEVADTPATFSATSPVLNIPTSWDGFLGIQIERNANLVGVWENLPGRPYTINAWDSPKTVTLNATHRAICHGKRLRLIGVNDLAELDDDDDTTTAPAAWLAKTAAYELLEATAQRKGDVATAYTFGELLKQQAIEMKQYVGKRFALGPRVELRQ